MKERCFKTHTWTAFAKFPLSNLDSKRSVVSSTALHEALFRVRLGPALDAVYYKKKVEAWTDYMLETTLKE